jgi:hypothetical protein
MQPQTNTDLVFENLADTNASVSVRSIYSGADLTLLDLRFDNGGGFSFVTTNGEPTGSGGFVSLSSGPGAGQITYSGLLSNDTSTVLFSTVTTPSAARPGWVSAQGDGESGWLDGPLNWIYAPFSSLWCSPGWALKDLQCKAAAFPRTLECVGSFPFPRGYVPIGFIVNKTQPKIVVTYNEFNLPTGFKIEGVCGAQCETCCRHPNPFANIYVDCVVSP